jgi:2-methylcitrate dehydratase
MHGITGPLEVFEGNKGFQESVSGPFELDWSREDLERVTRTILKKHNAEIHAQTAVEAALELRARPELGPDHAVDRIERIAIDTFEVAHRIIGGGEEGDKTVVGTKEAADHSLQYMVSVALLDGELGPSQYRPDRIAADDVQSLLRRVQVRSDPSFSERFPSVMPVRVTVTLDDGRSIACSRDDYEGFHSRPMTFEEATSKLDRLGGDVLDGRLRRELVETLGGLEEQPIGRLAGLLAHLGPPGTRTGEITS